MAAASYTGFDESDTESYTSVTDELDKIETYIKERYNGTIRAAYGCSLGGTFVAHLAARHNIHMRAGIIGSSDMDQAGSFKAGLVASLMVKVTYNFIHTGRYKSKLMQKRYESQMADPDPYNRAFVAITGRDKYDMSFITKESIKNQIRSDLTTPLPIEIDNGETQIAFQAKDQNSWWNGLPVTSRLRQMTSLMAQINCIGGKAHAGMNGSQAQRQDHAEKSAQYAQTQGLFLGSTISKQWSQSCRRNQTGQ